MTTVMLYHDVEQDSDSDADPAACRQAVSQLLALERRMGVSATYNVVGRLFVEQPDLIEEIRSAGQDLGYHSYHHYPDWNPEHYAPEVRRCQALHRGVLGYRSPRSQWDASTVEAMAECGFAWNAESDRQVSPYFIRNDLVRLPIAGDDWPLHLGRVDSDGWIRHFEQLLSERECFGFGSHDTVTSFDPTARLGAWEDVIRTAKRRGADVVDLSEAADRFRRESLAET